MTPWINKKIKDTSLKVKCEYKNISIKICECKYKNIMESNKSKMSKIRMLVEKNKRL